MTCSLAQKPADRTQQHSALSTASFLLSTPPATSPLYAYTMACVAANKPETKTTWEGMEYTICRESFFDAPPSTRRRRRPLSACVCRRRPAEARFAISACANALPPAPPPSPPLPPLQSLTLSVHASQKTTNTAAPKRVLDQLTGIFGPSIASASDLLVVPTCQRAATDLVATGDAVDAEKDRLLERFVAWAVAVCTRLSAMGHWCDYIDPCSGLPVSRRRDNKPPLG